jgi:hypothetical protein
MADCNKKLILNYIKIMYLYHALIKYFSQNVLYRLLLYTYVHSYSFHRSTHSKGSEQMTLAQGLLEGQCRSRLRAMVACPHWVPFIAGGSGRCFPSSLISSKHPDTHTRAVHYIKSAYAYTRLLHEISDFHSGNYEDDSLLKRWSTTTTLHCAISQKAVIFILDYFIC